MDILRLGTKSGHVVVQIVFAKRPPQKSTEVLQSLANSALGSLELSLRGVDGAALAALLATLASLRACDLTLRDATAVYQNPAPSPGFLLGRQPDFVEGSVFGRVEFNNMVVRSLTKKSKAGKQFQSLSFILVLSTHVLPEN